MIEAWMTAICDCSLYPTGEHALQAFSRTLVFDQSRNWYWQDVYPGFDVGKGFSHWMLSYLSEWPHSDARNHEGEANFFVTGIRDSLFKRIVQEAMESIQTDEETWYLQTSLEGNEDALIFQDLAMMCTQETSFSTTVKGYMGQGLQGIKAGDEILLVAGVSRPLIARRMGERYRLIGQAYVHGVMYGEKWPVDESELVDIMFQ
ncbi:hypothetical protein ONS95_006318 [Cadophora gregata]|uniref:uncharacterized protein n=1 Tax=Cadophora gregata TaxID=51156 RepID=UPI0026DD88A0|nr:uncharacterized protein ONS95_006318 [Cadophora gregata]KAK0099322.1 hypothetical protein ONS96_008550 [Cadophora gregata f. sp. sojae]KAK0102716.1 hypothetical protein ONS95_006318 [Cadophora gregata]